MRIVWSPQALGDRDAIWEYIASDNPAAAMRIDTDFEEAVDGLADHPELGRPGLIRARENSFRSITIGSSTRSVVGKCGCSRSCIPLGSGRSEHRTRHAAPMDVDLADFAWFRAPQVSG